MLNWKSCCWMLRYWISGSFPGNCEELSSCSDKELILLDARNLYETRIGKFRVPYVKTLDPAIRQYSDLPSWIDDNSERLRGNNILMWVFVLQQLYTTYLMFDLSWAIVKTQLSNCQFWFLFWIFFYICCLFLISSRNHVELAWLWPYGYS